MPRSAEPHYRHVRTPYCAPWGDICSHPACLKVMEEWLANEDSILVDSQGTGENTLVKTTPGEVGPSNSGLPRPELRGAVLAMAVRYPEAEGPLFWLAHAMSLSASVDIRGEIS